MGRANVKAPILQNLLSSYLNAMGLFRFTFISQVTSFFIYQ